MTRLTHFALRRSKLVLGAWLAVVATCAGLGFVSGDHFAPPSVTAPGSETERWIALTEDADFGTNVSVLLTGPEADLRPQGTLLVAELRKVRGVRVVSPYDEVRTGGVEPPRTPFTTRRRNTALLAIDIPRLSDPADGVAEVRDAIHATIDAPVVARVTGTPVIAKGVSDELDRSSTRAELIAVPVLMLVLLLIFRSPVAAAVPLLLGFGSVLASKGIIELLATRFPLDPMAVNMASMMALALGVDYSLLLASRYREHRARDATLVHENIERASAATRRTIATATTLVLAVMAIAMLMSIAVILRSVALGVIVATTFGAATALIVAPALLRLLNPWFERWRLPDLSRRSGSRFAGRQPIAVPIVALLAVLALAWPTLAIAPGSPDIKLLPERAQARADYEQIGKVVGPGIGGMFDIAIRSRDQRPLTERSSLLVMARLQRRIAAEPGVAAVVGPGMIAAIAKPLDGAQSGLARQSKGLRRLNRGLARAADGTARLGRGAAELHDGSSAAHQGAVRLAGGVSAAAGGSRQLAGGIVASSDGGERLSSGSRQASAGADRLSSALEQAGEETGALASNARIMSDGLRTGADQLDALDRPVATAEGHLATAWRELQAMTSGRDDPRYRAALAAVAGAGGAITGTDPASGDRVEPGYEGVAAGIDDARGQFGLGLFLTNRMASQGKQMRRGLARLTRGARRLDDGLARIANGNAQLSDGLTRLADASGRLPDGLGKLDAGAATLAAGLQQIDGGSGQIAERVGNPQTPGTLANGLDRMHNALDRQQGQMQLGALTKNSPNLFSSGSFPLAVVNGTARPGRERAQFVLDLNDGGRSARILAVPAYATNDPRLGELRDRLSQLAGKARGPRLDTAVGGTAASVRDFMRVILQRLPWMIAAFALVSLVVLTLAVRSIPLAAICVVLNLLTVAVAFGAMQLAFGSADPLLGGPGYVDIVALFGALAIVFALSIDYQVFLLARIREEYAASHDTDRAIDAAIGSTARVITGAATVMVSIFVAFALSSHIGIREVGVGLATAVFLDATVVRLILLPAAMRLAGERIWWFPAWLDRRVPDLSL